MNHRSKKNPALKELGITSEMVRTEESNMRKLESGGDGLEIPSEPKMSEIMFLLFFCLKQRGC